MKNFVLCLVFGISSCHLHAQYFNKLIGDNSDRVNISNVLLTVDSGYAIFGTSNDGSHDNLIFLRLQYNGDTLSATKYSGSGNLSVHSAQQLLSDSSFYLSGTADDSSSFIAKVDWSGNILWQKNYRIPGSFSQFRELKLVDNDSIFVLGIDWGGASFLLKMDLDGNIVRHHIITLFAKHFLVTAGHDVLVTGFEANVSGNGSNCTLIKMNSDGQKLWSYCADLFYNDYDLICETSSGNYLVSCNYSHTISNSYSSYLVLFDSLGNYIKNLYYDVPNSTTDATYYSLIPLNDGGATIMGSSRPWGNYHFNIDIDSTGITSHFQHRYDTILNGPGFLFVPINQNHHLTAGLGALASYDPASGNCLFSDSTISSSSGVFTLNANSFAGIFDGVNSFVIDSNHWNISKGLPFRNACLPSSVNTLFDFQIRVYPNPSSDKVFLDFSDVPHKSMFILYNINGQLIFTTSDPVSGQAICRSSDFAKGIYYYIFRSTEGILARGKISFQ